MHIKRHIKQQIMNTIKTGWILLGMIIFANTAHASNIHPDVQRLLNQVDTPEGVVFDIESADPNYWKNKGAFVRQQINALRSKYPDLDIVIVSHGRELKQLATASTSNQPYKGISSTLQQLANSGVELNVCAVASQHQGIDASDYGKNIGVADSGPANRNNYIQLGYTAIYLK